MDAFPHATVWGNTNQGQGYDTVLLGQADATRIDVDALQVRLNRPDLARVAQSLSEVGFTSVIDLLSTYGGRGPDLAPWLVGAQRNRDRNLRLQFLAGMGNNEYQGGPIYSEMLSYRTYPERLFSVSGQWVLQLREAIAAGR